MNQPKGITPAPIFDTETIYKERDAIMSNLGININITITKCGDKEVLFETVIDRR